MSCGINCMESTFQIWDFDTGQPLEMAKNELCTASCMMNDGERIVLGRTEKFGGGTTIVIWDLLANEAVRRMDYKVRYLTKEYDVTKEIHMLAHFYVT